MSTELVQMHGSGSSLSQTDEAFGARYTQKVVLRRTDGTRGKVTVLNTHVIQRTERWKRGKRGIPFSNVNAKMARRHLAGLARLVATADTRYVVVAGDFNWDYIGDQRTLKPKFVERRGPGG